MHTVRSPVAICETSSCFAAPMIGGYSLPKSIYAARFTVTVQHPRMPGTGGDMRTFHFIKAASELADVTLVYFGDAKLEDNVNRMCATIIQPDASSDRNSESRASGGYLLKAASVLAFPWKNRWIDFLTYCRQYCNPASRSESESESDESEPPREDLQRLFE